MTRTSPIRKHARASHGHAILVALALVLGLMVLVTAVASMVVQELKVTKTERDYERALQMAEAGVNAYLNMLAFGPAGVGIANRGLIPPSLTYGSVLTISQFKSEVENASSSIIPRSSIIYYPAGQTNQCWTSVLDISRCSHMPRSSRQYASRHRMPVSSRIVRRAALLTMRSIASPASSRPRMTAAA